MLVRPHPRDPRRPQVVLLDHGLYRRLQPAFRRSYCRLWQALVTADQDAIQRHCTELRAGNMHILLSAILTMQSWDSIVSNDLDRCCSGRIVCVSLFC